MNMESRMRKNRPSGLMKSGSGKLNHFPPLLPALPDLTVKTF
jgi:hypothetical protein